MPLNTHRIFLTYGNVLAYTFLQVECSVVKTCEDFPMVLVLILLSADNEQEDSQLSASPIRLWLETDSLGFEINYKSVNRLISNKIAYRFGASGAITGDTRTSNSTFDRDSLRLKWTTICRCKIKTSSYKFKSGGLWHFRKRNAKQYATYHE